MDDLDYESKIESDQVDQLCEALLKVKNKEECCKFLEDICTIKEVQAIAQRLEVAKLLKQKKTYIEIEKETKASTATISRINRSLNYGVGGYRIVFERMGIEYKEDTK